jgi:hypothetical protein
MATALRSCRCRAGPGACHLGCSPCGHSPRGRWRCSHALGGHPPCGHARGGGAALGRSSFTHAPWGSGQRGSVAAGRTGTHG